MNSNVGAQRNRVELKIKKNPIMQPQTSTPQTYYTKKSSSNVRYAIQDSDAIDLFAQLNSTVTIGKNLQAKLERELIIKRLKQSLFNYYIENLYGSNIDQDQLSTIVEKDIESYDLDNVCNESRIVKDQTMLVPSTYS